MAIKSKQQQEQTKQIRMNLMSQQYFTMTKRNLVLAGSEKTKWFKTKSSKQKAKKDQRMTMKMIYKSVFPQR